MEDTIAQLPVTVAHVENRDCAMEFVLQMGRLIFFSVLSNAAENTGTIPENGEE